MHDGAIVSRLAGAARNLVEYFKYTSLGIPEKQDTFNITKHKLSFIIYNTSFYQNMKGAPEVSMSLSDRCRIQPRKPASPPFPFLNSANRLCLVLLCN